MKKINLSHYTKPERTSWLASRNEYSVYFGNGIMISFTSETKCKKFLAETNRFMNVQLQELNQIYIQLFTEYRRLWFMMDSNLDENVKSVNTLFIKMFGVHSHYMSNTFAFRDFLRILEELREILEKLTDYCKSIENWVVLNILASLDIRCENMFKLIMNYGKDCPDGRFKDFNE